MTRATTSTSPAPATPSTSRTARAPAHHGQPALLGAGDARRRLPLRSRRRSLARAGCTRSTAWRRSSRSCARIPSCRGVKLIAEPWDLGRGGYQVGQLPGAAGPSGTTSTATPCARLLAGRRRRLSDFAPRFTGSQRPLRAQRPPAARERQLHHRARRLHAARSGQLRRKHNEANGEDNRDGADDNRSWNSGVEGPTDDRGDRGAARAPAAQLPRHAAAVARRADAARPATRSGARSTATTTPTARTTRSRGSTGQPRTSTCSTSRGGSSASVARTRCSTGVVGSKAA